MSAALRQFWRNYPGWVSASDNSGVPTTYTRSEDIHMSLPEQEYLSAYEGVIARALRILPPGFIGKTRLSRLVGERILQKAKRKSYNTPRHAISDAIFAGTRRILLPFRRSI